MSMNIPTEQEMAAAREEAIEILCVHYTEPFLRSPSGSSIVSKVATIIHKHNEKLRDDLERTKDVLLVVEERDQLAARCAELEKNNESLRVMHKEEMKTRVANERKAKALDWLESFYQNPGNFTLQFCDSFYRDRGKMPLLEAIESAMKKDNL